VCRLQAANISVALGDADPNASTVNVTVIFPSFAAL
jgi:hypothetical protein